MKAELEALLARNVSIVLTPLDGEVAVSLAYTKRHPRRGSSATAATLEDALKLALLKLESSW